MAAKIPRRAPDQFPVSSFQHTPLQHVRTLYAAFIQGLLASAPRGSGYHWDEDPQVTEILVTDENPIHMDTIGSRVAVTLTRGPVQSFGLGMDDMVSMNQASGAKTKSVLIPGTMSINVISRNDLFAEDVAWIIGEQLWLLREHLMARGFFEIGRNFVVGSPSPAGSLVSGDSADEAYAVVVQSPFQFQRTGTTTPLGLTILQSIKVRYEALLGVDTSGGGPDVYPAGKSNPSDVVEGTYPTITGPSNQDGLRRIPDPRNPARMIVTRPARAENRFLQAGLRGHVLPIGREPVEESSLPKPLDGRFKV